MAVKEAESGLSTPTFSAGTVTIDFTASSLDWASRAHKLVLTANVTGWTITGPADGDTFIVHFFASGGDRTVNVAVGGLLNSLGPNGDSPTSYTITSGNRGTLVAEYVDLNSSAIWHVNWIDWVTRA